MRNSKISLRSRSGQVLVEFAIIWPVLVLSLIVVLTLGYYLMAQQVVTHAAVAGAREGAITNSDSKIRKVIRENMRLIDPHSLRTDVDISPAVGPLSVLRRRGQSITVAVEYDMPRFLRNSVVPKRLHTVRSQAVRYIECENKSITGTCSTEVLGGVLSAIPGLGQ